MRNLVSVVMLVAVILVSVFAFVQTASAEEVKMVGAISKIEKSFGFFYPQLFLTRTGKARYFLMSKFSFLQIPSIFLRYFWQNIYQPLVL